MSGLIRPMSRKLLHSAMFARFVAVLERFDGGSPYLLRVLTYHRVAEPDARPDLYPTILSAAPHQFARQMKFLAERYHVLSMPELVAAWTTGRRLHPMSVLITFDDAYRDFAEIAWPVMQQHNLPATLFVPTGFPDHPARAFWWDRIHQAVWNTPLRDSLETPLGGLRVKTEKQRGAAVKTLTSYMKSLPHHKAMEAIDRLCGQLGVPEQRNEVLGWHELRRLANEGVSLGAHTRTHPLMNRLTLEEAREEAVGSLRDIEHEVGGQPAVFAYPAGGCTHEVARMLEHEGFQFAFTTDRGLNNVTTADPLLLRRINVGRGTSEAALRAQLLRWMNYANRWVP